MDVGEAVAIALLAFGAALVGTISGFGFALLIVPPLSFVVGAKEAVVLSNVLGSAWLMAMLIRLRRDVAWRTVAPLAVAAFFGMPFGLLLIEAVSARTLQIILAVNVLAATALIWRGVTFSVHGLAFDGLAGFISGVLNTSTSMNGPPIVLHLQNQGMAPIPFRATLSAFFVASSLFALALYLVAGRIDGHLLASVGVGLPGLSAGLIAGQAAFRRLNAARFRTFVIAVLFASAVMVLVRAATG